MYGEEFEPAEELFDLKADPYELKNIAHESDRRLILEKMRALHDAEIALWKEHAVPYGDYRMFGKILDRNIPWSEKKRLIPDRFPSGMSYYREEISN